VDTAAQAFLFGQFIGNTDMHFGNLSFFVDNVARPRFEVAPIYDMLPMMWRPSIHSDRSGCYPCASPGLAGFAAQADAARDWAVDYWQRAAAMAHWVRRCSRYAESMRSV
jgi:serine/threonine protein kinase HipA of HipAB toxin-antitoxin module